MRWKKDRAMARPRTADKPLTEPFGFRLTEDEARELRAKIATSGLTASEFLRDYVLKNQTTVVARATAKPSLEKTRMQYVFNKAGNNLNQIAYVLNSANLSHRLTDSLFRQASQGLEDIAKYLRAALGHVD
jgi:hypothetical protein